MFNFPEFITVWNVAATDGFGGKTWNPPIAYPARIAYSQTKFTDKDGDSKMSTAVCYSEGAELGIESMVLLGESSEAVEPPQGANDVRALSHTPSGQGPIKKCWFA